MSNELKIREWYEKKSKLDNQSDLEIIYDYIRPIAIAKRICISNSFKFKCIKTQFENIRFENIFKLNWMKICRKLNKLSKKYFPKINIICKFESPSNMDYNMQKYTFKHDVYIIIENLEHNKYYDFAIEYFEKDSHTRRDIDNNKELYCQQMVYQYIIYREEANNIKTFFLDTIYKILLSICVSCDDIYNLAKINFFKNNHYNPIKLKNTTDTFINIVNYHKSNKFNFEKLFNKLLPKNLVTKELFEMNEFIEFLEENYNIIVNIDDNGNCNYNLFTSMILDLDINISQRIKPYKDIYSEAMNILLNSQKEIINYVKETTEKQQLLPEFLTYYLTNKIQSFNRPFAREKAYENLRKVFY